MLASLDDAHRADTDIAQHRAGNMIRSTKLVQPHTTSCAQPFCVIQVPLGKPPFVQARAHNVIGWAAWAARPSSGSMCFDACRRHGAGHLAHMCPHSSACWLSALCDGGYFDSLHVDVCEHMFPSSFHSVEMCCPRVHTYNTTFNTTFNH